MNQNPIAAIPDGLIQTPQGIWVLKDDTHLSRWVEEHKRLDVAEGQIDFYKHLIPVGGTVVDAGASIGDCTLTFAKLVGPSGHVFAFEPHPLSFIALKLNFEKWTNVVPFNTALAESGMQLSMIPQRNSGASYVLNGDHGLPIEATTLDDFSRFVERCDLLHLDAEGFEPRILSGGMVFLEKFRPAIVLEINHGCLSRYGLNEEFVMRMLTRLGYVSREIEPHLNSSYPQRDILALPNEHPKRIS